MTEPEQNLETAAPQAAPGPRDDLAPLREKTIVLVGLMGVGKSSVGRRLAGVLGLPFRDADHEVEAAAGRSISEIFAELGEAAFRDGERRVIGRLLDEPPHVLATGGGAFVNPETRALINQKAVSVWLQADVELLARRVSRKDNRPLVKGRDPVEVLTQLARVRNPAYAEAQVHVQTGDTPHMVAVDAILAALRQSRAQGVRPMIRTVPVGLGERAYDVVIGPGMIDKAGERIAPVLGKRKRVAIVTDSNVGEHHGERLAVSLEKAGIAVDVITIPPGEESKSFEGLADLSDRLLALGLERGDQIVAFGGGVVGDLAGFAAAIYKRGVDFVQVPTTLLAQVDSSVGGKTAIDTPRGKNLIGAFHQPRLVLADLDVLATLPARELACGYAEIIKYGLLGDFAFFEWLETNVAKVLERDVDALVHAVGRSVAMKAQIVEEDEKEAGRRALLNLGHTFGHAIEAEMGFGDALKHGEAVGVGMAQAFRFSASQGLCPRQDAVRATAAIKAAGLPTTLAEVRPEPFKADALVAHCGQDKKAEGGQLTFVLVRGIGDAFVAKDVDREALKAFLVSEGAV